MTSQPDLSNPALALSFLPLTLDIVQLRPSQAVPPKLLAVLAGEGGSEAAEFVSLTRTPAETSIIAPTTLSEEIWGAEGAEQPAEREGPWAVLKVAGPMDLSLSGILQALTTPLKAASIPIFASSTWDTDYVLIKETNKERAQAALSEAGWRFP
ncbi:hypothetical protein JCM10207_008780 [Rhodosporidiobolus poonsookiae]